MNPNRAWAIHPNGPLSGEIAVAGSKNVVTKLMVAALLGDGPTEVLNAPCVGDVEITAAILRAVGAVIELGSTMLTVDPAGITDGAVPVRYSGLNRIPILMIGPLLHRLGEAFVPLVGGDAIGTRPVDFHLDALRALGAEITVSEAGVTAKASRLHGARIRLPFPSVGATETVLMAAATAEGRTVLENAAIEPEVVELALFLQRMGAGIELQPDRRFVIEGKTHLTGARQRIGGDRIEAFSYLIAGLVTGGSVRVSGCSQARLVTAISTLRRMGAHFEIDDNGIRVHPGELRPTAVHTSTHPGFMTDWQPALAVLFTQVAGMSLIHETVFEDRLGYVKALTTMGAEIELYDQCLGGEACRFHEHEWLHSAVVHGKTALVGTEIEMPDIRAAFAYVLAAAAASTSSVLSGVDQLERGYDHVVDKFRSLGLVIDELS
ncbi:MAG TPA: UDP-N-acetylglucosamine 1-carboxyvinyltransferase [Acidimicrobiales bacterium]|nr:UDP-N-acetylglucosamine 1-carboxyvinyltransferase [Acidimicrobiales bacterium]